MTGGSRFYVLHTIKCSAIILNCSTPSIFIYRVVKLKDGFSLITEHTQFFVIINAVFMLLNTKSIEKW